MRSRVSVIPGHCVSVSRSGATLTEVLMSLLIMSVGVVSVFSLFPISILSSIRATQLTNSKILEENVVEIVRTFPSLLAPPVPNSSWNWQGAWKSKNSYNVDDVVWPNVQSGELLPEPYLLYICTNVANAMGTNYSGISEPDWTTSGTVVDGDITWTPIWPTSTLGRHYVVDPLGRHIDGVDGRTSFGYDGVTLLTPQATPNGSLFRTSGGVTNYTNAIPVFTLPDSWTVAMEVVPSSVSGTTVTLPSSVSADGISTDQTVSRVVLSNVTQTQTVVRFPVSGTGGNTIELSASVSSSFNGPLRVETFTPRYSYFFVVRRPAADTRPEISAVILFNRGFNFSDEQVYDANLGNSGYTDTSSVQNTSISRDQIVIAWDDTPGGDPDPLIREGNYLLDSNNAIFYQITDVSGTSSPVIVTVDRPVEVLTTDGGPLGHVILMPGIVKIFEL